MNEQQIEVTIGEGFAAGNIDGMGDGPGFRKIRAQLEVKEMGVNAIVLPPGIVSGAHWHERQEEVYFVHKGLVQWTLGQHPVTWRIIWTRSAAVNRGALLGFTATTTTSRSNIRAPRSITDRWPHVMGSNVPA